MKQHPLQKHPLPLTAVAVTVALTAVVALAGCGSSSSASGSSSASSVAASTASAIAGTTFPVTLTAANGAITIKSEPTRIVSLDPTSTEDLYAVGAGKQVVAVDAYSDYPAGVPKTSLSGLTQQQVLELVDGLRGDGRLTVLSTPHDLTAAGQYADELVLLNEGHVVASGPLTEKSGRRQRTARVPGRESPPATRSQGLA